MSASTPTPAPSAVPASACFGCFDRWVSRLVHDHRGELARLARREGLGPEDAFDAVQEAFQSFLTLPAAQGLVDAAADSRNLLVALTRNVARNRRRLHALARPHDSDAAALERAAADDVGVDERLAVEEERLRLRGCVQSLAEIQRAVVTLRMLDEVAGQDVAHTLGIEPGHVAVLLHRAKANLLACMTADDGQDGQDGKDGGGHGDHRRDDRRDHE